MNEISSKAHSKYLLIWSGIFADICDNDSIIGKGFLLRRNKLNYIIKTLSIERLKIVQI